MKKVLLLLGVIVLTSLIALLRWYTIPAAIRNDLALSGLTDRYYTIPQDVEDPVVARAYLYRGMLRPIKTLSPDSISKLMRLDTPDLPYGHVIYVVNASGELLQKLMNASAMPEAPYESAWPTDEPSAIPLTDTTVRFLWRGPVYDSALQDTFNSLILNEAYLPLLSDPERAAIGYVATFIGNECQWDGDAHDDWSNLDCTIITALGLGYQCSDQHLGFLRNWFSTDKRVIFELETSNCPIIPYTATRQNTFDEIVLEVTGDLITIVYKANGVNLREQESWEWSETVYFRLAQGSLELIQKDKSPVKRERF